MFLLVVFFCCTTRNESLILKKFIIKCIHIIFIFISKHRHTRGSGIKAHLWQACDLCKCQQLADGSEGIFNHVPGPDERPVTAVVGGRRGGGLLTKLCVHFHLDFVFRFGQ